MNRTLFLSTPKVGQLTVIAPVNKGGTGGKNVIQAAQNLGGINNGALGSANGVLKADGSGKVPSECFPSSAAVGPTIIGSKDLIVNMVTRLYVSNFDSRTTYNIGVDNGVVSMVADEISIKASKPGPVILTINGRNYTLTAYDSRPDMPTLTGVATGNGATASITLTASRYLHKGPRQSQRSADWEIYSDPLMVNLRGWSIDDMDNLQTKLFTGFELGSTFYARVRYRSTSGQISDWSYLIAVTTQAVYYNGIEEAKLVSSTPTLENMGFDVALSRDGSRAFVAAVGDYSANGKGSVYVFARTGNVWTQEARLAQNASVQTTADRFGQAVATTGDGSRIVIGCPLATVSPNVGVGGAYVFVRNGTTWTQEQKLNIPSPDNYANSGNGNDVSISDDGSRVILGSYQLNNQGQNAGGAAFIFSRSGSSWTLEAKLTPNDLVAGDGFGSFVSMSGDGSYVLVGAVSKSEGALRSGAAYTFVRTGTTWTQQRKFYPGLSNQDSNFGQSGKISADAKRLVIGCPNLTVNGQANVGAVFVYSRAVDEWNLDTTINQADVISQSVAQAKFGFSVDINDASDRLIVGAFNQTRQGELINTRSGYAYVFSRNGDVWTRLTTMQPSDPTKDGVYGYSVSFSGDGTRTLVGAQGAKTNNAVQGGAYIQR